MDADTVTSVDALAGLVRRGGVVVLSGAGISTESGIPDYRGPSGRVAAPPRADDLPALHRRPGRAPPLLGAQPRRLAAHAHRGAERRPPAPSRSSSVAGLVVGTITQNVDGLHQAAGAQRVIDLHGRLDRVVCLSCGTPEPRARVRERLDAANATWSATITAVNPDGDVDLPDEQLDGFTVVDCERCGGVLKPDVVYFGENVPAERVAAAYDLVDAALGAAGPRHVADGVLRAALRAARGQGRGARSPSSTRAPPAATSTPRSSSRRPIGATMTSLLRTVQDAAA